MQSHKQISPAALNHFAGTIRLETLKEFAALGFGHVGGAMSVVEVLAALYGGVMRFNPKDPDWKERDRLVMSKGHAGPALYATLALLGYFPMEQLLTLNKGGTSLPSHCDMRKTAGVDMTTGSLGQGMSTAIGLALGQRLDSNGAYTFLILGDGELNEGQVWEGAQFAPHYKLTNLIAFVDVNGKQLDGDTASIMNPLDLQAKFTAFGWETAWLDGHDAVAIRDAVIAAKDKGTGPHMFLLKTVKGHGCGFVERMAANHHVAFEKEVMEAEIKTAEAVVSLLADDLAREKEAPIA